VTIDSSLSGARILIVDDHEDSRDLLELALRRFGATTVTAGSAEEAREHFVAFRPMLVISDIAMPDEDGCELARRLSASPGAAGVTFWAASAQCEAAEVERALAAGFSRHFAKPLDFDALVGEVAALVEKRP